MSGKNGRPRGEIVVAMSGLHGSGKSTHARRLAPELGLRYVSAGELFRRIALERGISLEEMTRLANQDPEIDKALDARTKEESRKGGIVIDAALAGWMAENADIKIFLKAPFEARMHRIAVREGLPLEEAKRRTLLRERVERERYRRYYGVDVSDLSIYDVVLNTELFDPDATARILKKIVDEYCSSR